MSSVKRINPKLTREQWERIALELFMGVYDGQMGRVMKTLARDASPQTIAAVLSAQFDKEPPLVQDAVRKFYDDMAISGGQSEFYDFEFDVDWEPIKDELFTLSRARSHWFAAAMTETSQEQTQEVIAKWLQTEGSTVAELRESVRGVWIGPRPDAAATTETTYMFSESRFVSWEASGVWGYGINTRNDDRVRDTHAQAAAQGPYPLSDRDHRPPVFDDVNCRCTPYPVRVNPRG